MITKEQILQQLRETSPNIATRVDKKYDAYWQMVADELAFSYQTLTPFLLEKTEKSLPDNDYQSALLYWKALNSVLSAIELSRRGYITEPQMILRNVLEMFSVALDFHINPARYDEYVRDPSKFNSPASINVARKFHVVIGQWYGLLSDNFTHVGPLHTLPHQMVDRFYVGGIDEESDPNSIEMGILMILGTTEVLNSLLEFTFLPHISNPRYWQQMSASTYTYRPNVQIRDLVLGRMEEMLSVQG